MVSNNKNKIIVFAIILLLIIAVGYLYFDLLFKKILYYYALFSDRKKIELFIKSFGVAAPLIFTSIQILQVVFAPIPGEVTGFVGGYLFGFYKGFIFSSIGLSVGSFINFILGRYLGKNYIRSLISQDKFNRFDNIINNKGLFFVFLMFAFPGFPKDILCIVLGISNIPFKIFMFFSSIGRMPGTLLLSMQGASIYEKNYILCGILVIVLIIFTLISYPFIKKMNKT